MSGFSALLCPDAVLLQPYLPMHNPGQISIAKEVPCLIQNTMSAFASCAILIF